MGLAQGLLEGSITPCFCMSRSCRATACQNYKGNSMNGSFLGVASPVSIWNCIRSVLPCSPSSSTKPSCLLNRRERMRSPSSAGRCRFQLSKLFSLCCRLRTRDSSSSLSLPLSRNYLTWLSGLSSGQSRPTPCLLVPHCIPPVSLM